MEKLGYGSEMAGEIALGPFGHTFTTPRNEHILWQTGVRIPDFHKRELYFAIRELFDKVIQLSL